jgi:hypothetical protein
MRRYIICVTVVATVLLGFAFGGIGARGDEQPDGTVVTNTDDDPCKLCFPDPSFIQPDVRMPEIVDALSCAPQRSLQKLVEDYLMTEESSVALSR